MAVKHSQLLFRAFLLALVSQLFVVKSLTLESFPNLEHAQKGEIISGLNQVKQYLNTYGYYPHEIKLTLDDKFDNSLEMALKEYQKYISLDITGKIDASTIKAMMSPRCGLPDIIRIPSSERTLRRHNHGIFSLVSNYSFPGYPYKWRTYQLTYNIQNGTRGVPLDEVRRAIAQAFNSWAGVSPFNFTSVAQSGRIQIGFFPNDHGDGYPFNGALAHAFYPEDGRLHFNQIFNWTTNPTRSDQADLESVGLHEQGHNLGLNHSQDANAVMYPYYTLGTKKRVLTQDDINGLKALYGY